jgi:DHA1 family inner membrane transport protein
MFRRLLPLSVATFAIGTDSFVVAGILPQVAGSLQVTIGSAGQLVTAYALAYALFSPIVAIVASRWSRNTLLLVGLTLFIVANIATALVPTFALVIVCRVLAGLGAAAVTPGATVAAAMLVPPEKRGTALSIVTGGLAVSTALGAPIGTAIGAVDWRITMYFVAALGAVAAVWIALGLKKIPAPPPVGLRQRLAPLGDPRIALVLLTTLLAFTGNYVLNTYVSQTFGRATEGSATVLAVLLLVSGLSGAVGNFGSGPLTDRWGSRRVLNVALAIAVIDFALTPWTGGAIGTAIIAFVVWGIAGWSLAVPQQYRLFSIAPQNAQFAMSLNSSVIFLGVSFASVIGAVGLDVVGPTYLGVIGAVLFALALVVGEAAHGLIKKRAEAPAAVPAPQPAAQPSPTN